jgi:hypothetical protein
MRAMQDELTHGVIVSLPSSPRDVCFDHASDHRELLLAARLAAHDQRGLRVRRAYQPPAVSEPHAVPAVDLDGCSGYGTVRFACTCSIG